MQRYLIAEFDTIDDQRALERYRSIAGASVAEFGGTYLTRASDAIETLEGSAPKHVVVIRFPDAETLRAWYESDAYAPGRASRHDAGKRDLFFVQSGP